MFLNLINSIIYYFWLIQIFNSKQPWQAWINMQILIISPITGYAHCVAEHDQFPSHIWIGSQRGYSFMHIISCASRPDRAYTSPGQTPVDVFQFEVLLWSWTSGCQFHQGNPLPWLLIPIFENLPMSSQYYLYT